MPQKILWLFPRTSETFVHVTPAGTASTSYFLQTISGPILQALLAIPRVQGSEKYLKFSCLEEFPLANPLLLPSASSPHQAHALPPAPHISTDVATPPLPCQPLASLPEPVYIILTAHLWPVYIPLFWCQHHVLAETTSVSLAFISWHTYKAKWPSQSCQSSPKLCCFLGHPSSFLHICSSLKLLYWIQVSRTTPCRGSFTHDLHNDINTSLPLP